MLNDLRYAIRLLLKTPGFTAVAVLSLALGIGANTALFSVVDAMLLKMLPVKDPERLVLFRSMAPREFSPGSYSGNSSHDPVTGQRWMTSFPYQSFQRMREQQSALSDIFAFGDVSLNVNADGQADVAVGQAVSGNYFAVLGVHALAGSRAHGRRRQAGGESGRRAQPSVLAATFRRQSCGHWQTNQSQQRRLHRYRCHTAGLRRHDAGRLDAGRDHPDCLGAATARRPRTLAHAWRGCLVVAADGTFETGGNGRSRRARNWKARFINLSSSIARRARLKRRHQAQTQSPLWIRKTIRACSSILADRAK